MTSRNRGNPVAGNRKIPSLEAFNAVEKYNGWTNYETWVVASWIDKGGKQELVADYKHHPDAVMNLAADLKEAWSEHELEGVHADLLHAALDRVNWYEIASSLLED